MMTSAYLALRLFQPDFVPVVVPFDQIEKAVLGGDVDAGLLIHEGQLTYKDDGLHLIADMGAWWLEKTGFRFRSAETSFARTCRAIVQKKVSRHLRESIAYGLDHRKSALDHAMRLRARTRPEQGRHFRRDVRERLDTRLWRARSPRDQCFFSTKA